MNIASERRFWLVLFLIPLIMLNPPVLYWVNNYAVSHLLTFGLPTMWLWTWLWLIVWFVEFGVCSAKSKIWRTDDEVRPMGGDSK